MKIFPKIVQFKKWSLPSKASYVGLWLGFFGLIVTLIELESVNQVLSTFGQSEERTLHPRDTFLKNAVPNSYLRKGFWAAEGEKLNSFAKIELHFANRNALKFGSLTLVTKYEEVKVVFTGDFDCTASKCSFEGNVVSDVFSAERSSDPHFYSQDRVSLVLSEVTNEIHGTIYAGSAHPLSDVSSNVYSLIFN